jgi:AraC-like DNA-binding protein
MRDVLRDAGIDADGAFRAAQLDPEVADHPEATVSGLEELSFQLAFARLTDGRHDLWLKAGEAYSLVAMGDVGLAAFTAATLGALVGVFAKYADFTFWLDETRPVLDESGNLTAVELRLDDVPVELREFNIYRHLGISVRIVGELWGHGASPVDAIEVPLLRLSVAQGWLSGVPVRRGSAMRWLCTVDALHEMLPNSNELLHRHYVALCDDRYSALYHEPTIVELVRDAILSVATPPRTIDDVARRLHVSVRTLERQLRAQCLTYRQLRREVQIAEAKRLLQSTSFSIGEIATRLGYDNTANFSAAFRHFAGETPTQWRAANG